MRSDCGKESYKGFAIHSNWSNCTSEPYRGFTIISPIHNVERIKAIAVTTNMFGRRNQHLTRCKSVTEAKKWIDRYGSALCSLEVRNGQ
jgi:hypothetical protein